MRTKHAFLFCVFFLLTIASRLSAQDFTVGTGSVGNGGTTYPSPLPGAVEGSRSQYLFRASELQAAGLTRGYITGLKYNVVSVNNASGLRQYSLKMDTTSVNSLQSTTWENSPAVLYSNSNLTPTTGVNSYPFTNKFFWNGTSNLLVEICVNGGTGISNNETANATVAWTTGLSFNASHTYGANDITNFCTIGTTTELGTATTRPNITFTWTAAPPDCNGAPDPGTVSSNQSQVCPTDNFTLTAVHPATIGLVTQWQYSTNNVTWNNISGATTDVLTTTLAATTPLAPSTYYRQMDSCMLSRQTAYSPSVLVNRIGGVQGTFVINNSLPTTPVTGPFKSFNDAYNNIKCGISGPVVFNVVNTGTPYNEQLIINSVFGTSATNTITFNGNGATINYLAATNATAPVIRLNGAHHVIIDNLNITALGNTASQFGWGVHLTNDADSNTISRCNITVDPVQSNNYAGIVMSGGTSPASNGSNCDSNSIRNNTIKGGQYAISIMGGTSTGADYPVNRNQVLNNTIQDFGAYGIYMSNNLMTRVEGNDFSRPLRSTTGGSLMGVYLTGTNVANFISKNKIHAMFNASYTFNGSFYGIYFSTANGFAGSENVASNNEIYDIKCLGTIYGLANSGSSYANYYYNTVVIDDINTAATVQTYGFYATNQVAFVDIKNNIFSIVRGGTALKYGMCMASSTLSLFTINYNNYFSNGHPTYSTGYYNNTAFATLADWQKATKFDTTSVAVDPAFKNLSTGDLTPTSAAMMNKGTPVVTLDDIASAARDTKTPDVGAVEYNLPGCTTSFLPGDAFANVGYATCVGKSVILNLKNNDVGLGLTYQWQTATSVAGTWSNLSTPLVAPPYTFNAGNNTIYYRAAVACNGGTPQYTVPIQIVIGGYFPAGTYTIDQTQATDPVGTKNFNSFKDAASAISCGIAGPVVFKAKPGVYNDHIRIGVIGNSSAVNTVTFQSESGNPAGTELTYNAPDGNNNYTVQLDSASNVTFKNLTVSATNAVYARAFDLMNIASNDSIVNCVVNSVKPPASYFNGQTDVTGIYAGTNYTGGKLVIKGNTFHKGARGIYISGLSSPFPVSTVFFSQNDVIEGNLFDSCYQQSIYASNASSIRIVNNTIPVKTANAGIGTAPATSGIYMNNCDSANVITGNYITLENNTGYIYGIYMTGNNGTPNAHGKVMNNKIYGLTGLTNQTVGLYNTGTTAVPGSYTDFINNEISVSSSVSGATNSAICVALFSQNGIYTNYYNNSLLNTAPGGGFNVALWADHPQFNYGGNTNVLNNIIVNRGAGPAIYYQNASCGMMNVDYNLMYTGGPMLVRQYPIGTDYPDLASWRKLYASDYNSLVYNPAFTSTANLQPLASDPASWSMQGRGVQIAGNNVDINGNARPVLLTDGVPDIGAYEFDPTVAPPDLVATPATPAPGITQSFSFGTDTVTRITWDPSAAVPTAISLKRYSGRIPAGLNPTTQSMYYYVAANVTGSGPFKYKMQQNFIDSWMRNLPSKSGIKTGQTNASNTWVVSGASAIDSFNNIYSDTALTLLDKFTGMTDGKIPVQPVYTTTPDSSNTGTRFWAPYPSNGNMLQQNNQTFKFILASTVATQATVTVHGTGYSKTYSIPAGGTVLTDEVPKWGAMDARMITEGLSNRAVLVESKDPITVATTLDLNTSTAYSTATIQPTGTYAKEYKTLGTAQYSSIKPDLNYMGTSWVTVIADNDNTVVQITPSGATVGGQAAGVPFQVTLNRGQAYQILGAYIKIHSITGTTGSFSYESVDLTGTTVVSLPNSAGKCMPVAVFNGSSGTNILCNEDQVQIERYIYQQSFPMQAWGKKFLTAPLATRNSKSQLLYTLYRVMVKDPATVVKVNGSVLSGLRNNTFYQFSSNIPQYIEANKPITVSQNMTFAGSATINACGNEAYSNPGTGGAMTYLTPIGLGVKNAVAYRKVFDLSYITAIVPTKALSSFKIDGSGTFDSTYVHPQNAGYTVVMKSFPAGAGFSVITCDSNFTAIDHMPNGSAAYLYNVGYQVPRVNVNGYYNNVYNNIGTRSAYTCAGTTFKPTIYLPVAAKSITWKLSAAPGATPSTDVTVNNPVAVDTVEMNSQDYYEYTLNQPVSFATTGNDTIPVSVTYAASNPLSCDQTVTGGVPVVVKQAPDANFSVVYDNCIFTTAQFTEKGTVSNGAAFDRWSWNFGDNTTANIKNPTKKWNQTGSFNVGLMEIANDGCFDSTSQKIAVNYCDNVFIPNSFTPNGDGHNDQFKIYASNVTEMKMMIFNQWGQKIFETTNMASGWDGTLGGKPQPSGVYMYVCRIVLTSGEVVEKKGSINLLR